MYKEVSQTNYRIELRQRILKASMREFLNRGVKSVKMDDIANSLGISKRTLYEIYANKEELLLESVKMHETEFDQHMKAFLENKEHNVIDIIVEFYKYQLKNVTQCTPRFFGDIQKYNLVVDYLTKKKEERRKNAISFFMRGVEEGFFRKEVDYQIVLRIGNAAIDFAIQNKLYEEYDVKHLMNNFTFLMMRGLCTAEGIAKLDLLMDAEFHK